MNDIPITLPDTLFTRPIETAVESYYQIVSTRLNAVVGTVHQAEGGWRWVARVMLDARPSVGSPPPEGFETELREAVNKCVEMLIETNTVRGYDTRPPLPKIKQSLIIRMWNGRDQSRNSFVVFDPPTVTGEKVRVNLDPRDQSYVTGGRRILLENGFEVDAVGFLEPNASGFVLPDTNENREAAEKFFKS